VHGHGLFSGQACRLRFCPAPPDTGIAFVRTDLASPTRIRGDIAHLAKRARRTSLQNGSVTVETVEHVLAAVWGLGIDNLIIELSTEETPAPGGSSQPFVQALQDAGLKHQDNEVRPYVIAEPVAVSADDGMLAALPGPDDHLDILYDLDYAAVPSIGRQILAFQLGKEDFAAELAPARTFLLEAEAREFRAKGIGTHLSPADIVVMSADGPVDNTLRFPDEHVRHKICDLIGDIALLGSPLCGRIVAYRSGHDLNHALVQRLAEQREAIAKAKVSAGEPVMDIRKIMRLLKHRYPLLMVDRVLSLEGDRRAIGVKNVTINEPFFQGHYPGQPIMPGVMILEALAQLSGILLSRRLEHTGKVAILLSMDRVKMRRTVRPGDQLILEAEAVHVRTRTGHCRCKAHVGSDLAAEAEIKFMLVDDEPA
jgi:UDP-3-O-[3-hydroxymyristoyl] N-acetylglucosamine deacetylase/3-hydroxyacyl-[acyl-carrier-protein] dehydratase